MVIRQGSRVRSFDFADTFDGVEYGKDLLGESERAAYVEGVVVGISDYLGHGYMQYKIRVERDIFGNEERTGEHSRIGTYVYPPLNGTPKMMGEPCNNVEII